MSNATEARELPDILILHGLSNKLVDYLRALFSGVGLKANNAIGLPSLSLPQEDKVDHYIKECRVALVVVSFDESDPKSHRARPNVYDELARCLQSRRTDTIVLQEQRDTGAVELPSNVHGRIVLIPFSQNALHEMIPALLKEISSRRLLAPQEGGKGVFLAGATLNDFLDKMDEIWDHEFDDAWGRVHQSDFMAESELAIALDSFFQQYQHAFSALVREGLRGPELAAVCQSALLAARLAAAHAWAAVTRAKLARVNTDLSKTPAARRRRAEPLLSEASAENRKGQKAKDPAEGIRRFRHALELLDKCAEEASRG